MYIDARTELTNKLYTTNTLALTDITPTQLSTGVQPQGGTMVTNCEIYHYEKGPGNGNCH